MRAEELEPRVLLVQVFWDGGAGSDSWHDALNWSNDAVPTAADDVTIAGAGAEVQVFLNNVSALSLTLLSDLRVREGRTLSIFNGATVAARVTIGQGLSGGTLLFTSAAMQTLQGPGEVLFDCSDPLATCRLAAAPGVDLTLAPDLLIRGGNGTIGPAQNFPSTIRNLGTIIADVPGRTLTFFSGFVGATLINQGVIQATNGSTIEFDGEYNLATLGDFRSVGGTVRLDGTLDATSGLLQLNNQTGSPQLAAGFELLGGTISGADGQTVLIAGDNLIFDGVTLNTVVAVDSGRRISIRNGLTLNGTLTLGSGGGGPQAGELNFTTTAIQTLSGTGEVVFDHTSNPPFTTESISVSAGVTLTIGAGITVRGGNGFVRGAGAGATIINQGTIAADVTGREIIIQATGGFTNNGLVEATGGATITLNLSWTNNGDIAATGSTLNLGSATSPWSNVGAITSSNSNLNLAGAYSQSAIGTLNRAGGTVNLRGTFSGNLVLSDDTGIWNVDGVTMLASVISATGSGGLAVTGNSTLDGVTLNLSFTAAAGRMLTVRNGLTLNGTLTLGSGGGGPQAGELNFTTTAIQTLSGTGEVVFDHTSNPPFTTESISVSAGVTLTIGAGITVRGGNGFVRGAGAGATIINQGTIAADVTGREIIIQATGGFTNNGLVEATGGATISLDGNWSSAGGIITINAGTLNLGGTFTTAGLNLLALTNNDGLINLTGTLINTGDTLFLDVSTGSIHFVSGTILGGTVTGSGGAGLVANSNRNGTLDGVTLNAPLLVTESSTVTVRNGLELNSVVSLGGASSIGTLTFATTANQTLTGDGEIAFVSTGAGVSSLTVSTGVSLTIGPDMFIRGGNGTVNVNSAGASFINQGTVLADFFGRTLTLTTSNPHGIVNQGMYVAGSLQGAGTLVLASTGSGSHDFGPGGSFRRSDGSTNVGVVRLTGTLDNAADTLTINATTGSMEISGGTITGGTVNLNDGVGFTFVASTVATFTDVQVNGELVVNNTASSLDLHLLGTTRFTRLTIRASTVEVFFPSNGTIFDEIVVDTVILATGNATLRPSAAASSLTIAASGIVRVAATSTRGVSFGVTNTQPLINNGLIEVLAAVSNTANALVTNNGTMTLAAGSLNLVRGIAGFGVFTIAGAATNTVASTYNGTVNLQTGGTLTGAGDFDLVGILNWTGGSMTGAGITTLAAAGELYITGAATKILSREFRTSADGFWTEGTLAMSSGSFTNEADTTLTLSGSLMVSGISGTNEFINEGILRFLSGVEFEFGSTVLYSTLPGSGTEIDGDVVFDEDASFDGGVTLKPTGSISGPGNVVFNSTFIWEGGTLAGPGTVTVSALGFMSIEGPDNKHLNTTLDHFAVGGNWTGGCIVMSNGYFTNRTGATFDIFADPMLDVVDGGGSNTFDNAGLITIHTGTVVFGVPGTNTGTIIVIPPDTLVFMTSWTYTPASSLEGPGGVEFAGGSHVFPPGTFGITGPITLSGGGLSIDASDLPYYDAATYTFFGAHWSIGPGMTFALSGGEIRRIAADASITLGAGSSAPALASLAEIDGALTLEGALLPITPHGGTLTSRGAVSLAAGSLLDITGSILLESASTLMMDIGGGLPSAQGRINATIAATFGGTLDARWSSGYSPEGMFDARLIGATTMSGSWASATYADAASSDYRTVLQTDALGLRFVHTHRADWNLDLDVTVNDIFAFLADWFAGNGDFDGAGGTEVTDIFSFLTAWFSA